MTSQIKDMFRQLWMGHKTSEWFHSGRLVIAALVFLAILSFSYSKAMVALVSLLTFVAFKYFNLRKIFLNLKVERSTSSDTFSENESVKFIWQIENQCAVSAETVILKDNLEVFQESSFEKEIGIRVRSNSFCKIEHEAYLDGGMGRKSLGPTSVLVSDGFGWFKFERYFNKQVETWVAPSVAKLKNPPQVYPKNSMDYGGYSSAKTGYNINFKGVREYRRGDSLKHIAWKASAKGGGLKVKTFESDVNAKVSVILNLDQKYQVGQKSESTWERSRDFAISLLAHHLGQSHSLSFFSNVFSEENKQGRQHFQKLAKSISNIKQFEDEIEFSSQGTGLNTADLLSHFLGATEQVDQVYLITPITSDNIEMVRKFCFELRTKNIPIDVIYLLSANYFRGLPGKIRSELISGSLFIKDKEFKGWKNSLRNMGVNLVELDTKRKIESLSFEKAPA